MTALFIDVAVRALLVAVGTAAVLWAMRIRTAAARHTAWTAVVIAMLLLPIGSAAGFRLSLPILRPEAAVTRTLPSASATPASPVSTIEPTTSPIAPVVSESVQPLDWQNIFLGTYLLGAILLLARLIFGTVQANRLRRRAVSESGRLTSRRCVTPIIRRPGL